MARLYLYHVTPTCNVDSILKNGLVPRSGKWRDHEWPARVWFANSYHLAYSTAWGFLLNVKFDTVSQYGTERTDWIRVGGMGEYRMKHFCGLSIIKVLRPPNVFLTDHPEFRLSLIVRKRRHGTFWTAETVSPSLIVSVIPYDPQHEHSAGYRRFIGHSAARGHRQRDAEPPYLSVRSAKGKFIGIKKNLKAPRRKAKWFL